MLDVSKRPFDSLGEQRDLGFASPAHIYTSLLGIVRRQLPIILFVVALVAACGLVYLFTTPPSFTAMAKLVIDTRKVQLFQQQSVLGDVTLDSAAVETQVEILKSENISLAVIKDLHLVGDPEFTGPGSGLLGAVFGYIGSIGSAGETLSEFELTRRALSVFERQRLIKRIGLTYVIDLSFRSLNPERAAQIANAMADAYIVDQLEAKYQATRRASSWLQDRIRELRTEAAVAEKAVLDFKQKNKIIDTGGRLMNDQQLAEVNSQLITARAQTAESKARLARIQEIMQGDITGAAVNDSLGNVVITTLRSQFLQLKIREADFSRRFGANHLATVNLRNQMGEIKRSIMDELGRIAESYKSDYEIAQAREASIQSGLANVVTEAQSTNQAQLGLRELESNAQTYRALYDNFLQRFMEATQQQSFPITEARLISPASRPLRKSHPNTLIVMAMSLAGGLVLAFGVALLREFSDNVLRTTSEVENLLNSNCLAVLPMIKAVTGKAAANKAAANKAAAPRKSKNKEMAPAQQTIVANQKLLSYVVDAPFSRFAEAMRTVRLAADMNDVLRPTKVLGITSTLPNEGKSTVAANFAQLLADTGASVILVDCDLRNPSLSRAVAPDSKVGMLDVVMNKVELKDAIYVDPKTNLQFLPAGVSAKLFHSSDVLASDGMKKFIDNLKSLYAYVVVDLPPLGPVVDVRATTNIIESFIFVVEWGRTKIDVVQHHLAGAPAVYDKLLGVVLNKADLKMLNRYESYYGHYYYNKYYARYGYSK